MNELFDTEDETEQLPITPRKKKDDKYFTMPNSPASNTMINVVSHAGDLDLFGQRLEENSHSTKLEFYENPEGRNSLSRRVKYSTDNTETTVHLDNIDAFAKANKPLKKILTYTLVKLSKANVDEYLQNDLCIRFPLEDFVELGSYKNITTARQAFNSAKNPLTSIKIEGLVRDKKDMKQITDSGIEVLFTGAHIKKGICEIYLNQRINWKIFALQYFSILPKSYFSLSDNAADILLNMFIIARKRLNEIESKNHFNISFRTLQQILDLPNEGATKNPSRDIQQPILHALEEVTNIESGDISINPVYNKNGNIAEFLTEGYAEITFYNEYSKYFLDLAHLKSDKIEQTQKKREMIKEKAQIKQLASKNED